MKNALWLLMVCAQSPQVAEEACKLGYAVFSIHTIHFTSCCSAIEVVGVIAQSGDHQSANMAQCARDRLFGANLPAKYWVNGSLALTDSTIGTEFYDAGPVSNLKTLGYH